MRQRTGPNAVTSARLRGTVGLLLITGLVTALVAGCSSDAAAPAPSDGRPEQPVSIRVAPAAATGPISPTAAVTVTAHNGTLQRVTMTNPSGEQVDGTLAAGGSRWTVAEPLGYDTTYTIRATAVGSSGKPVTTTSTVTTVDPEALAYPAMSPIPGSTVGIGHPLAFYFDVPIEDKQAVENAIEITTDPAVQGAFYWFSDTEVHWRPREFWAPGTQIEVDVNLYGLHLGNGVYGQTDRHATYTIGDAVIARANGATHQMTVEINGEVVRTMPISMGSPEYPSSTGVHVVTQQYPSYVMDSRTFGLGLDEGGYVIETKYATRISNSGEFVHAAPWSVDAQGERNVSHGCINLSTANARWFYNHTQRGDVVIVTNSGGPPLQPWDGFGDWQIPWPEWKTGGAR